MEYDYIIGFDFGHGETSVAKVDVGAINPTLAHINAEDVYIVGEGHEPKIPSMIGYDVDRNVLLNFDAYSFKHLQVEAYFKAPMVSSDKFSAISEKNKKCFRDFVITVFNRLHSHYKNQDLINKRVLYFAACPSGWNKTQKEEYLSFFTDYCSLPISGVIEESRAAHVVARRKLYEKNPDLCAIGKKIAVLDLGSSTLDITMHSDRTYSDGYEIGASKIEELLLQYFLNTSETFRTKYNKYEELESSCENQILFMLRMAKEDYFNKLSNDVAGEISLKCQVDWEELSNEEICGVSNLKIKDSEFRKLLESDTIGEEKYINKLRDSIRLFIDKHGMVDSVVLTGGASVMPFYKNVVLECYNLDESACVVDRSPSYSISQGTAIMGYLDTMNPLRIAKGDPEQLKDLINHIPALIKSEVLKSTIDTYKIQLSAIVEQWECQTGPKTLKDLFSLLVSLLESWDKNYDQISASTNQKISKAVSTAINASLEEMMKLYFGFNMQLASIDLNYDFSMTLPEDASLRFLRGVAQNFKEIINHTSFFTRFKSPRDWDEDRSSSPNMLSNLAQGTKLYISKFFNQYDVDAKEFEDTIEDCKEATKKFYYDSIQKITCQV